MAADTPVIPQTITVHLGRPNAAARNVTVPFTDYLKNVASSEIYPTWPDNAIRANIYAQASFALPPFAPRDRHGVIRASSPE